MARIALAIALILLLAATPGALAHARVGTPDVAGPGGLGPAPLPSPPPKVCLLECEDRVVPWAVDQVTGTAALVEDEASDRAVYATTQADALATWASDAAAAVASCTLDNALSWGTCDYIAGISARDKTVYLVVEIGPVKLQIWTEDNGCEGLQRASFDCDGDGTEEQSDDRLRTVRPGPP